MSNPLVSIVIPAYNSEAFITGALESVYNQTYRPLDVIIVDDGSTDRTKEIIGKCLRGLQDRGIDRPGKDDETTLTDRRIEVKYMYQKNSGPSKARNTGIAVSRGEYIAFLDADDLWRPEKLERQVRYLIENPDISFVFGDMTVFSAEGTIEDSAFRKYGFPTSDGRGRILDGFSKLLERNFVFTGTELLKKECLEKTGLFDESSSHGEDYDLWLRIALMFEIGCIHEVFMNRRLHDGNISREQENFYKYKIRLLENMKGRYSSLIKQSNVDINRTISMSIKKLSYYYYVNRRYLSALKTIYIFILFLCKQNMAVNNKI